MPIKKHYSFLAIILIIVVCANLVNVRSVLADGETPTEPPPPTQVATEPPVESTSAPVESTPDPIEATATPLPEILTQIPESTEIVILDESGDSVPLATQEAVDIAQATDPMWCPEGVAPGGAGCTTNFPTISALINNMVNPTYTASYANNGVIYFTASPGNGLFDLSESNLGTSAFNTLKNYNLTLQGGWNGDSISPSLSGQTDFGSSHIVIGASGNPWIGNVTLNDIAFCNDSSTCSGISQTALTVYTTTGNIALNNVDVNNQGNGRNTSLLNTISGNITVTNGTYDGNNSNSAGFSATTNSGSITISNTNFKENKKPNNGNGDITDDSSDGATLSAPIVTLTNVIATANDGDGITINNANVVTLSNVTASGNGTAIAPAGLINNDGSGVFINGNAGSRLIIIGGAFNNNQEYGVEVGNPANISIYIQSNPTCTGNVGGCYNDATIFDNTAPIIVPTVNGTIGLNGWYISDVSVSWSVNDGESGILSSNGCAPSNLTAETVSTILTCSASNNAGLSNSASVTIQIDKAAPNLSLPSDITTQATGPTGAIVNYSASAIDSLDQSVSANCSPISGSTFSLGTTTVNCFATDEAGNTALGSFQVTVQETTPTVPTTTPIALTNISSSTPGSSTSQSNSSAFIIPLTGGELINLDCNSAFWAFGVKLSFMNLCNQQTTLHAISVNNLPGQLPNGFTFVMGLDVSILSANKVIEDLPSGTGIQMDFPISGDSKDQFAVLYWNGSKWIEISQQIGGDKLSQILSTSADNEFYQVQTPMNDFYQIITTDKTGIFVLVKK